MISSKYQFNIYIEIFSCAMPFKGGGIAQEMPKRKILLFSSFKKPNFWKMKKKYF